MKGLLWKDICDLRVVESVPNLREVINEKDSMDHYALHVALWYSCFDKFCYFIDCGANIHIPDYLSGGRGSLLHVAVEKGSKHCVEKLLVAGIDVNSLDRFGETPLHVCVNWRYFKHDILLLLLKYKANLNVISKENKTPLDIMLHRNSHKMYATSTLILINVGGKLHSLKRANMHPNGLLYVEKLAACTSAKIAVRIALKKTGKVHKDVIPLIEALVFQSWEKEEWIENK